MRRHLSGRRVSEVDSPKLPDLVAQVRDKFCGTESELRPELRRSPKSAQ